MRALGKDLALVLISANNNGTYRYPDGSSTESNTVELIHDAFQDLSYWDGFMVDGYDGVAMDTHIYQMFTYQVCTLPFLYDATMY